MPAKLLDGKLLASQLKESLKTEVDLLKKRSSTSPSLHVLLTGSDASASSYAASQKKTAEAVGINYKIVSIPSNATQEEFIKTIRLLNNDERVHGIMVHKPVPEGVDYHAVSNEIDALKDVEGMNERNLGKLLYGKTTILPCTPASVMEHLYSTKVKLRGKETVIVGRSEIVGKPLALMLLKESATVTVCHTGTFDAGTLIDHVKRADIVIAAVGKANFVKGEWIKKGAIVIDVGINRTDKGLTGDVEFDSAQKSASFITPVPGGVGPVTAVILMKNTVEAFKIQNKIL